VYYTLIVNLGWKKNLSNLINIKNLRNPRIKKNIRNPRSFLEFLILTGCIQAISETTVLLKEKLWSKKN
jgi:hypothetical protein